MSSAEAAEFSKLADTTYRDVNIALANEFARYADRVGRRHPGGDRGRQQPALQPHPPARPGRRRPLHPGLPPLPAQPGARDGARRAEPAGQRRPDRPRDPDDPEGPRRPRGRAGPRPRADLSRRGQGAGLLAGPAADRATGLPRRDRRRPTIRSSAEPRSTAARPRPYAWGEPSDARAIITQTADPALPRRSTSACFPTAEILFDGRNSLRAAGPARAGRLSRRRGARRRPARRSGPPPADADRQRGRDPTPADQGRGPPAAAPGAPRGDLHRHRPALRRGPGRGVHPGARAGRRRTTSWVSAAARPTPRPARDAHPARADPGGCPSGRRDRLRRHELDPGRRDRPPPSSTCPWPTSRPACAASIGGCPRSSTGWWPTTSRRGCSRPPRRPWPTSRAKGSERGVSLVGDLMQDLAARVSRRGPRPGRSWTRSTTRLAARPSSACGREATCSPRSIGPRTASPQLCAPGPGCSRRSPPSRSPGRPGPPPRDRGRPRHGAAIRLAPAIRVIEPQGYRTTLALQLHAAAVLTDSGGVQRESAWLGVPCLVLRDTTEWVEAVEDSAGPDGRGRARS